MFHGVDAIFVGMAPAAYGWICDDSNPYSPPPGTLMICSSAPAGQSGSSCQNFPLGGPPMSRPDAASACGGNPSVGWGFYLYFSNPVYAYYRHPDGSLQPLGGSGKVCTQYGWCY
jgi:hypothetical protein